VESGRKRGADIDRELGNEGAVAASLGRIASIFMAQGQYREADERYDEALQAVRRAGDKELEGTLLQHQGLLARKMQQYDRAADLYKRLLKMFQAMNDEAAVMQTCNLLGVVEHHQDRQSEARAWYERSRQIAVRRREPEFIGQAAVNIGIVCQEEGEAARARGDETTARQRFEEAAVSVWESLRIFEELGNQPDAAWSHSQLATIYLLLSDLDRAEEHAQRSRQIREGLGLKEVERDYGVLAAIARVQGNEAQAADWQRKRDEVQAEQMRRAQGEGGLPPRFLQAIQSLAVACARAGVDHADLDPQAEAALAEVEQLPAPLNALAAVLRGLAAGDLPAVPDGLPQPLTAILVEIVEAVKQARDGA
jgi:tetratricopeptide (TPR) repeat protein